MRHLFIWRPLGHIKSICRIFYHVKSVFLWTLLQFRALHFFPMARTNLAKFLWVPLPIWYSWLATLLVWLLISRFHHRPITIHYRLQKQRRGSAYAWDSIKLPEKNSQGAAFDAADCDGIVSKVCCRAFSLSFALARSTKASNEVAATKKKKLNQADHVTLNLITFQTLTLFFLFLSTRSSLFHVFTKGQASAHDVVV